MKITKDQAKNIWIQAQKLDQEKPFGTGSKAVAKAVAHLGYVQIDTIHVVERCHHHILYNRIPNYHRDDLKKAQSVDKTVFEYWTHALAYIPTSDFKFFVSKMKYRKINLSPWFSSVSDDDLRKVVTRLKKEGPITIRDIKDDVLVEKTHAWGSKKPSKKALQYGFNTGDFVISERDGMLKKYDLTLRHFGWDKKPKAVTDSEYVDYVLQRGLRSQGIISLDSVTHLFTAAERAQVSKLIEKNVKSGELIEVEVDEIKSSRFFAKPEILKKSKDLNQRTHILSPFDPLVILRKRLNLLFDYNHLFEAYIPKEKRKFGYFALPVLHENNIVAVLDLKTDRQQNKVLIQNWVWLQKNKNYKKAIEAELDRFTQFQLQK